MSVVDVRPGPTEVAVINLPHGTTARVHHAHGVREYRGAGSGANTIVAAAGDVALLGWGAPAVEYIDLQQVRRGRHQLDRKAWQAAVKAVQRGGVVYLQFEERDYYGKPRWTATKFRPA